MEELIQEQRGFFATGATLPLGFRLDALGRLEKALRARDGKLEQALAHDLGRPAVETFVAEVNFLLQEIRLMRRSLRRWLRPERVRSPLYFQPSRTSVRHEPMGTVLVIAPWNYPIQLALGPLIAAVAAGNTVVLKPSELAPASGAILEEIIAEAFERDHVAVVQGDAEVAAALLESPFDFIFFTGSTAVGRIVAGKAAERLVPAVLELGGKCPCVVDLSADLGAAARSILTGKLFNGGQTCFAPDFVVVHEAVKAEFVAQLEQLLKAIPWSEEMAHVVNRRHYDRLKGLLGEAEVVQGEDDPEALRLAPRILPEATWDSPAMREEIFGPILPVLEFEDTGDLVRSLARLGSPLALYLFSKDEHFTEQMLQGIRSGGVCVNDTMKQGALLSAPFGGVGESGYGRYRGQAGVMAFSYERIVLRRASWAQRWFEMVPPYEGKLEMLKRFLR